MFIKQINNQLSNIKVLIILHDGIIIIDYTNDFVADNGALTCGKAGQDIEDNIVSKIQEYADRNNPIFVINDIHYLDEEGHPESKL